MRPFRLVKYFTFTSLILIFIGALALSTLNVRWARQMQLKKSEDYARVLIENLNHQIFMQFVIPVMVKYGQIQLRNKEQSEHLDKVVRTTLHSFHVESVNIYDKRNIISYSFNPDIVGRMDVGGTEYEKAVKGGFASRLHQKGNFWQILLGIPDQSRLITFAPLRAEQYLTPTTGPVLGVMEIEQDLTADYRAIFKYQVAVVVSSALVMTVLFLALLYVVNRGEKIIQARAMERLKLREQLNRAQHLSAVGEMTAVISHEIRNPLGIIKSSADLLKKKMATLDPANPIPNIIVEEAGRLNNIITDFLSFARPKSPHRQPCSIDSVLEKSVSYLAPQCESNGHRIVYTAHENLPEVMADGDMLYQAFLNILINAMQAVPAGGNVEVNAHSTDNQVIVTFEDEGTGIAPEVFDQVWDPFFTTKPKGTGLGLGIVKNIIESHGGRVYLENREDKGVRLSVEIPVKTEEA